MNQINTQLRPNKAPFESVYNHTDNRVNVRTQLIDLMMENDIMLEWNGMRVTNPYFVYHMTGTHGLPIEMLREMIEEKKGEKGVEWIWTDWTEHWYNSFRTIPINLLMKGRGN